MQNFPTAGILDGTFRQGLEETGINCATEVEMIGQAHALDMLTTPYVFSADGAVVMTEAGADFIVSHMGLTARSRRPGTPPACSSTAATATAFYGASSMERVVRVPAHINVPAFIANVTKQVREMLN